jgi:uncharacterized phage infection (PIP) family protein YhgE
MKVYNKRTLAILLTTLLVLSMCSYSVSAQKTPPPDNISRLVEKIYITIQNIRTIINDHANNLIPLTRTIDTTTENTNLLATKIKDDTNSIKSKLDELDPHILLTDRTVQEVQDSVKLNQDHIDSHHFTVMDQFTIVGTKITANSDKLDTVIVNQVGADLQMDAYYQDINGDTEDIQTEIASIKQSIDDIEDSQSNVIMDTTAFNFGASTEVGLGIRHHETYDSMRQVSLTLYVNMEESSHIQLYIAIPNNDPIYAHIMHHTDNGFNCFEFNTDEWYILVGDNDGDPEVDCFGNVVTFEEA